MGAVLMLIEKKRTAELLPADYNPRKDLKPGDPEYEKLKRSIEQFGYVEPVIWNKTRDGSLAVTSV
jgi:ParB-like chromosome segregation protein Spo0J